MERQRIDRSYRWGLSRESRVKIGRKAAREKREQWEEVSSIYPVQGYEHTRCETASLACAGQSDKVLLRVFVWFCQWTGKSGGCKDAGRYQTFGHRTKPNESSKVNSSKSHRVEFTPCLLLYPVVLSDERGVVL